MTFETYFDNIKANTDKLYYNFIGINKKEYSKWQGWKIISDYKDVGIDIKDINDAKLDILVQNFYYIKYIILKY